MAPCWDLWFLCFFVFYFGFNICNQLLGCVTGSIL